MSVQHGATILLQHITIVCGKHRRSCLTAGTCKVFSESILFFGLTGKSVRGLVNAHFVKLNECCSSRLMSAALKPLQHDFEVCFDIKHCCLKYCCASHSKIQVWCLSASSMPQHAHSLAPPGQSWHLRAAMFLESPPRNKGGYLADHPRSSRVHSF